MLVDVLRSNSTVFWSRSSTLHLGDCIHVPCQYSDDHFMLLLTSSPYPGMRGCNMSVEVFLPWYEKRITEWIPKLDKHQGVLAHNITFKRTEQGMWDTNIFKLVDMYERYSLLCQDIYIWDKLNAPPSGNHDRHDRPEWEFCFVFARSVDYKFYPQRAPYSKKTVDKALSGNLRKADIAGSLAGGHTKLHPLGARQGNVLRISSSGDQGRPRVSGGVFPRKLADRFILTYTDPGDCVVDPFMGSGTTVVRAVQHGRKAVGIDIDKEAFSTARQWMIQIEREREQGFYKT